MTDATFGRRRRGGATWLAGGALMLCACLSAAALSAEPDEAAQLSELNQLSLAQLTNVEVTSVSKQPQKLLLAPAAIQVITQDDIRRFGATSLPQALRLADNLQVAQESSSDWAISARGFNTNLANKLLVLVDGRAIYSPLYGGVLWNAQDTVLADVDRVEVISGPGGTLWGANAVNGVINIVTKSAEQTQGVYAQASVGNVLEEQFAARYGGQPAPDLYLRVYGKYTGRGDQLSATGMDANDANHMGRGGFRLDTQLPGPDQFTLQGDIYRGSQDDQPAGLELLSGGNLLGRWTHTLSPDAGMSLQLYYDHTYFSLPYVAYPPAPPFFSGFPASALTDTLDTYDGEFQHQFAWGQRQKLVWGLGLRLRHEVDHNLSLVRFDPPVLNHSLYDGFVQDAMQLTGSVYLTVGSKLEHNDYTGLEVEPSVRLQWSPNENQLLWAAVSRAVRTPSRYDRELRVPTGLVNAPPPLQFPTEFLTGSANFVSETLVAYELGYRAIFGARATGSLSLFYNDYDHLRSTTATPTTAVYPIPFPVYFQNNLQGETHGLELTSTYKLLESWQLHLGYDLLLEDLRVKPGQVDASGTHGETADPQNQLFLRSSANLPHNVTFDAALRWIDTLYIEESPTSGAVVGTVPSYYALDARLAWQASRRLEISLVGHNLLHAAHSEYGYPSPAREQIARSIFGRVTWGY